MTSLLRSIAQTKDLLTRFIKPESPCYDDPTLGNGRLFPFTYSNGVLDISYQGNEFKTAMVDTLNIDPASETDVAIQVFSGPKLVKSLGENFKDYIRAWRDGTIDVGSPIEIYVAPQVIRVQQADPSNVDANSGNSYKISTSPPTGDGYVAGSTSDNYNTTYVFKTPLTFTILESGITQYITFRTVLDQE